MATDRVPMGQMDLGQLPRRWAMLDALYEKLESDSALVDRRVLTDRMIDESQTSGRRTYMAVDRCLSVARDNHEALISLLQTHGATQFAPWNLLRPTFEAAFYATWLLDPDDSIQRRQRGLRFEWLDELEHRAYYSDVDNLERFVSETDRASYERDQTLLAETRAEHDRVYSTEAAALRLSWPLPKKINVLGELGKLKHIQLIDRI